jgi:hypothetical protein
LSASNASDAKPELCSELQAARAAALIFGSCRHTAADDAELFTAAYKRILMGYPADVVQATADPMFGVMREHVWVPAPAELVAHLERRMAPRHEAAARARRWAESEALLKSLEGVTPEARARMSAHWDEVRAAMQGKASAEEQRRKAEERLNELWHLARSQPVVVSSRELVVKLVTMMSESEPEAERFDQFKGA